MTVGQLKNIISVIPDDVEVEADTGWKFGPAPLGKGYLIKNKLIFIQDGYESQEREYEAKLKMEYKFEIGAIIALLRKLLWAVRNYYNGGRTFMGVQRTLVEGVLEYIIAAMEAELEKEEKETDE